MRFRSLRNVNIRVLAAAGLSIAVILQLTTDLPRPWPRIFEGLLYGCCVTLLMTYRPNRQLLEALRRPQRRFVLGLLGLILLTQIVNKPKYTFPFVNWGMYSSSRSGPRHYLEFIGICENGQEVMIPTTRVFRSQGRSVPWTLTKHWNSMQSVEDESSRQRFRQQFRSLLTATVKRFNDQQSNSVICRVKIVECTLAQPTPGYKIEISRRPLEQFIIR